MTGPGVGLREQVGPPEDSQESTVERGLNRDTPFRPDCDSKIKTTRKKKGSLSVGGGEPITEKFITLRTFLFCFILFYVGQFLYSCCCCFYNHRKSYTEGSPFSYINYPLKRRSTPI